MIETTATVIKIDDQHIWVASNPSSACDACRQKTSCASNVLGSVAKQKSVLVDSPFALTLGDEVLIGVDEKLLLRSSLLLYLLPLLGLFIGAGVAESILTDNTPYRDVWQASSALMGLLLALWLIHKQQYQAGVKPVVIKKCHD